jgi:hypothetical protein
VPEPKRNDRWINAKTIWYRNLGEKVTTLIAPSGSGQVFAGTKKGSIYLLSAKDGTVCGYAKVSSGPVTTLAGDAGTGSVLAGTQDGSVVRVHLKGNQP